MILPATAALLTALAGVPAVDSLTTTDTVLAGIVYTGNRGDDADTVYVCDEEEEEDLEPCEVEDMVRQAASRGATLVVVSEAAFEMVPPEPAPAVGSRPKGASSKVLKRFSALADELDLYLVVQLEMHHEDLLYSGQVAFDPRGITVGRHFKLELYDSEADSYTAGTDFSVFDTPFGKVGMMICSDLYADPRLHHRLTKELGADIIALSSIWTVDDSTRWQSAFAHDWQVTVVAANGAAGDGRGAGIYGPTGRPMTITHDGRDEVITAVLD